jgi:cytochrome b561
MKSKQKFTIFHRSLHWIMALAMPVLFITGFLRMHWMNKNHIAGIIESKTSAIPKEQMIDIAKSILEPMWQWHEVFAHIMIFSFLARIIYMLVKGIRFPNPFQIKIPLKERLQGFTYVYFYLFVFFQPLQVFVLKKDFFRNGKKVLKLSTNGVFIGFRFLFFCIWQEL